MRITLLLKCENYHSRTYQADDRRHVNPLQKAAGVRHGVAEGRIVAPGEREVPSRRVPD